MNSFNKYVTDMAVVMNMPLLMSVHCSGTLLHSFICNIQFNSFISIIFVQYLTDMLAVMHLSLSMSVHCSRILLHTFIYNIQLNEFMNNILWICDGRGRRDAYAPFDVGSSLRDIAALVHMQYSIQYIHFNDIRSIFEVVVVVMHLSLSMSVHRSGIFLHTFICNIQLYDFIWTAFFEYVTDVVVVMHLPLSMLVHRSGILLHTFICNIQINHWFQLHSLNMWWTLSSSSISTINDVASPRLKKESVLLFGSAHDNNGWLQTDFSLSVCRYRFGHGNRLNLTSDVIRPLFFVGKISDIYTLCDGYFFRNLAI